MPLEDLEALGYTVFRPPADLMPPTGPTVYGFDRQWNLQPDQDEEEIVNLARNHQSIYTKLQQATSIFSDNYKNWATMTAQQKDTANRNAQRMLANLSRHVLNDLSSGGD